MGRTEGAGTFSRALPRRDGAKTAVRGLRQFSMAVDIDTPAHPPMKRAPAITASRRLRSRGRLGRTRGPRPRRRGRWQVARTAARSAAPPAHGRDRQIAGEDPARPFPRPGSGCWRGGPGSTPQLQPSRRSPAAGPGRGVSARCRSGGRCGRGARKFNGEKIRCGGESGGGVPRQRQSTPPPALFPLPFPGKIGEIGKIGQDS